MVVRCKAKMILSPVWRPTIWRQRGANSVRFQQLFLGAATAALTALMATAPASAELSGHDAASMATPIALEARVRAHADVPALLHPALLHPGKRLIEDAEDEAAAQAVESEDATTEAGEDAEQPNSEDEAEETLEEFTETFEVTEGLFTFYRDPENGELFMAIGADQFDQEFIYFSTMSKGINWLFPYNYGIYRFNSVFSLRRHFDRVELQFENTNYHFDADNALSRAKDANVSPGLAFVTKVKATSADGNTVLIPATELFVSSTLDPVKVSFPGAGLPFNLRRLNKKKSKVTDIRGYEDNVDVVVDYTYDGPSSALTGFAPAGLTDPRYVTVGVQHSFIAMPDDGFTPRLADQRVGFFTQRIDDQTATDDVTPYRDLVHRWRLVPQDPDAALSDPVEPIVWWIENTTPLEYRDAIREGVLRWNRAFEAAGISNAIQVRIQPDDADWDAGDIRYNVLRWTSSPTPPYGGYGPSFTNPRTGEIIGADVMLELDFVRVFKQEARIHGPAQLSRMAPPRFEPVERAVEIAAEAALSGDLDSVRRALRDAGIHDHQHQHHDGHNHGATQGLFAHGVPLSSAMGAHYCDLGTQLSMKAAAARTLLQANGAAEEYEEELLKQVLYFLALHEVGHTLGLNHNFKSSQRFPFADIHDKAVTGEALTGSVMEYPGINIAPDGTEQGQFMPGEPGSYDIWAIRFGYTPNLDDEARTALLAESTKPEHAFGNDADAMASVGFNGIDPRVMIWDMSDDALAYAMAHLDQIGSTTDKLLNKLSEDGETWAGVRSAFFSLINDRITSSLTIANYVGGVEVERFVAGQEGSEAMKPYTPVAAERQKAAIQNLRENVFAPDAFKVDSELARHLQPERRGFDFFGTSEDFPLHEAALFTQDIALAQLMSPFTMRRVVNSTLYGNEYRAIEYLTDLTKAVFEDDARSNVNTFRQNLQIRYVTRLIVMLILPFYDDVSQSAALASLREVRTLITPPFLNIGMPDLDKETKAHRRHVRQLLRAVGIF